MYIYIITNKANDFVMYRVIICLLLSTGMKEELENAKTLESESRLDDLMEFKSITASFEERTGLVNLGDFLEEISLISDISNHKEDNEEVTLMSNFVVGANELDAHLINVNFDRDFTGTVCDLRKVTEGDLCPICGKPLSQERGIEVGQIFKLKTKYSKRKALQNEVLFFYF